MRHSDCVAGDHQFHCLDLAGGFHVAQNPGDIWGELLVLQQGDGRGADAFEQINAPVDRAEVDVERPGQAVLAHAPVDGAADHVVLLDGGEAVDPVVVGVGLVILGKQARGFVQAQLFQGQHAQVAVQQEVLGFLGIGVQDGQGFDQSDLVDAGDDLLVLTSAHHAVRHLLAGQQLVQRHLVGLQLKAQQGVEGRCRQVRAVMVIVTVAGLVDAGVHLRQIASRVWLHGVHGQVHAVAPSGSGVIGVIGLAALPRVLIRSARYLGRVSRPSARSRFTKCSSANSFLRPCTTSSRRWWACSAFRTILRWRSTSRW